MVPTLGQLALLRGLITQAQLDAATVEHDRAKTAGKTPRPLGEILMAQGALDTAQITQLLQDVSAVSEAATNLRPSEDNPVLPKAEEKPPAPAPVEAKAPPPEPPK